MRRQADIEGAVETGVSEGAFVITRTFDAPRDLVWKAWAESEGLRHWWGPKGFAVTVAKLDFRPGGVFHYRLESPEGHEMWGRFLYREIVAPERIVWVNSFSDEHGGITRPPFSEDWPLQMLTTVTFAEAAGGRTIATVQSTPLDATEAERSTFAANHDSMRQGWTGSFDVLADYLAKA